MSKWLASGGIVYKVGFSFYLVSALTLATGTLFLMWLGEQITEKGIGNGISLIIFCGIVSLINLADFTKEKFIFCSVNELSSICGSLLKQGPPTPGDGLGTKFLEYPKLILSTNFADLISIRIAIGSGTAFIIAQLLDVQIFDQLRQKKWFIAPLTSSLIGSTVDTFLFFSISFYATGVPWVTLSLGDLAVKIFIALVMLIPFRLLLGTLKAA